MPETSKLEKLNRELEKSEKKLRKAINDEKALQHQLKQLTRKERTHRLCTRAVSYTHLIEPLKISRSISDRVDYPPIRLSRFGIISVSVRQFSPVSFLP